jgi:GT2 family glycosyltransferase
MPDAQHAGLSVVIPTWNGAHLLRESLPLLGAACAAAQVAYEVIVVDNGSEDETGQLLAGLDLPLHHIRLARNEGFSYACNVGVRDATHDRVLLLNNDILIPPHALSPLLEHPPGEVFAVGSVMVPREEAFAESEPVEPPPAPRPQLGVPTYCCVLDRRAFLDLGGFDLAFSPAMWEEMDLGVRVWRSGRRILIEPRSRVFHYWRATVHRSFTYLQTERIYHRNRLLFLWKHLPASSLLRHLLLGLPRECASDVLVRGGFVMTPALFGALGRVAAASAGRWSVRRLGGSYRGAVEQAGEVEEARSWP